MKGTSCKFFPRGVHSLDKPCPISGHRVFGLAFSPSLSCVFQQFQRYFLCLPYHFEVGTVLAFLYSVMSKTARDESMRRGLPGGSLGSARGSVLMEYVLVQVLVACALMLFTTQMVYSHTGGFGPLGLEICHFYQRILGGLSLPIP